MWTSGEGHDALYAPQGMATDVRRGGQGAFHAGDAYPDVRATSFTVPYRTRNRQSTRISQREPFLV